MIFKVGNTIGPYLLLAECGNGAYGTVFLAENAVTKRRYALKIVYRNGRTCDRELNGLSRYQLICPKTNLLQIYHVEEHEEFFYYTMDPADDCGGIECYVPDTLTNRLKKQGKLQPDVVKQMFLELQDALHVLHQKGLFHRDIKPDNIFWINGRATLGDIGLVTDGQHTTCAGTPGFLPPEILAGFREFRAEDDFYALGKVIYCAVTGLPVSHYPAFPDSGTLNGTGELIALYNRLCSGDVPPVQELSERPHIFRKILIGLFILLMISGAVFRGMYLLYNEEKYNKEKAAPAVFVPEKIPMEPKNAVPTAPVPLPVPEKRPAVQKVPVPADPVPAAERQPPVARTAAKPAAGQPSSGTAADTVATGPQTESKDVAPKHPRRQNSIRALAAARKAARTGKIAEYRKALDALLKKYQATPETEAILPILEKAYQQLKRECSKQASDAWSRAISPQDIANARKSGDARSAVAGEWELQQQIRNERSTAARKAFAAQQQSDPLWEYFANREKLTKRLHDLKMYAGKGHPEFSDLLQETEQIFEKQKELELILQQKYQK